VIAVEVKWAGRGWLAEWNKEWKGGIDLKREN